MSARQKARDLIELAAREDTPEKERVSAAVKAVALIRKHDLLSSPLDVMSEIDNDTVRAATSIFEKLTDPDLVDSVKHIGSALKRGRRRKR
jgi:hypothetical protein